MVSREPLPPITPPLLCVVFDLEVPVKRKAAPPLLLGVDKEEAAEREPGVPYDEDDNGLTVEVVEDVLTPSRDEREDLDARGNRKQSSTADIWPLLLVIILDLLLLPFWGGVDESPTVIVVARPS